MWFTYRSPQFSILAPQLAVYICNFYPSPEFTSNTQEYGACCQQLQNEPESCWPVREVYPHKNPPVPVRHLLSAFPGNNNKVGNQSKYD